MYSNFGNVITVKKCISELKIYSDKAFPGSPCGQGTLLGTAPFIPHMTKRPAGGKTSFGFPGWHGAEEQQHWPQTCAWSGENSATMDSRGIVKVKRAKYQDGTVTAATKTTQRESLSLHQVKMKLLDTLPNHHSPILFPGQTALLDHKTPPGWAQRRAQSHSQEISRAASAQSTGCTSCRQRFRQILTGTEMLWNPHSHPSPLITVTTAVPLPAVV